MAASTTPFLLRALHHLAGSGFAPEADSAFTLCRAACWSEPVARGARHLDFRFARSRLEYNVRVGRRQRMGWLVDRGGVEARVWDEEGGAPRWKLALFDTPVGSNSVHRPLLRDPAAHAPALQMLISKVGGAPHGGFVMPSMDADNSGFGPPIVGPLAAWRAANPDALVANVRVRNDLVDADFVHLAGIKALDMSHCRNPGLTDAAFVHLRGLHTLWMAGCNQASITDAAFVHLHGLHTLLMYYCDQPTITDVAFTHLRGIQNLHIQGCTQATITGATFVHLRGVRVLQASITDAAFVHLHGLHTLMMSSCTQHTITDVAFTHLCGIQVLYMNGCTQTTITGATFAPHLRGVRWLKMGGCSPVAIAAARALGLPV